MGKYLIWLLIQIIIIGGWLFIVFLVARAFWSYVSSRSNKVKYLIWLLIGIIVVVGGYGVFKYLSTPWIPGPDVLPKRTIIVYLNKSEPTDIVQVGVERAIFGDDRFFVSNRAEEVMLALLEGPTNSEKAEGLTTAINVGTVLNYIKIEDGVATVDFNDRFDFQMGGSARVQAIYQQIFKTLTQFPEVKSIKLTINYGERLANLEP